VGHAVVENRSKSIIAASTDGIVEMKNAHMLSDCLSPSEMLPVEYNTSMGREATSRSTEPSKTTRRHIPRCTGATWVVCKFDDRLFRKVVPSHSHRLYLLQQRATFESNRGHVRVGIQEAR